MADQQTKEDKEVSSISRSDSEVPPPRKENNLAVEIKNSILNRVSKPARKRNNSFDDNDLLIETQTNLCQPNEENFEASISLGAKMFKDVQSDSSFELENEVNLYKA